MTTELSTDYLIIGCGAVGMAFADVLLSETEANIIIVDKHHKPGGHWNDAYSFVTLHQPSAFYGVSSKELSKGTVAKFGTNEGLHELATGPEIMAYFDEVMRERFIPSGRVQYFPMCEYHGNGKFSSLLADKEYQVQINKKTIDSTYFQTSVPSTHTPKFTISPEVDLRPLNELPNVKRARDSYVVVGGGKTAIDACIWLLEHQIEADKIIWIMPRDAWLINRLNTQPGREFFKHSIGNQANQLEAMVAAESVDDLFMRLEKIGSLMRVDTNVKPSMFHGATVSEQELTQLRRIKNIVRMGRVTDIEKDQIVFVQGRLASDAATTLYVDCSASAVPELEVLPVFTEDTITVQTVRSFQPVFSAGFIAHVEATYDDDAKKNQLCNVIPLPNHDTDWIRNMAGQMMNQYLWSQEEGLRDWLIENRLDGFTALMQSADPNNPEEMQIIARIKENAQPAIAKLQQFIAELDAA